MGFGLSQSLRCIVISSCSCLLPSWIFHLLDPACPHHLVVPWISPTTLCFSYCFSIHYTVGSLLGWVSPSPIQRSLSCHFSLLVSKSLFVVLPLVLWILFVSLLTHLLYPKPVTATSQPRLRRRCNLSHRVVTLAALCLLPFLLVLSIGLHGHRGNYLDLPFLDPRGQRGLGLLAAGQEQWWRGESVLQTGLRQSACKTGFGVWCPAWDWSAHVCSPHQALSSVQLARSVAHQLSATPSLRRRRLASTWRLQGYLTPPSSTESNGCRHSLRVRGLSSLRAGGAIRCRRGWLYTGSGARGDQKAFSCFVGSPRWLLWRGGLSRRHAGGSRRHGGAIQVGHCGGWKAGGYGWVSTYCRRRWIYGCSARRHDSWNFGSSFQGFGLHWSSRPSPSPRPRSLQVSATRRLGCSSLGLVGSGDRIHYYSAAEELEEEDPEAELVPETSEQLGAGGSTQPGRRRGQQPIGLGRAQNPKVAPQPKAKRPTVASLAASFESVAAALPMLTSQLQELSSRTKLMEEKMSEPTRTLALKQPLGDSTMPGSSSRLSVSPQDLLKEMPPPQSASRVKAVPVLPTFPEAETLALEGEKMIGGDQGEMLKAMFAQSSAVTALAAQIANLGGDSLGELVGPSAGYSSKGASGRMKLQQELAQHKGTFFAAVLANMGRRMSPAAPSGSTPQQMMSQGLCLTKYVERFGGFGRQRDMGYVMWQVAMIMDYLQCENWEAARDATALLAVCLEQTKNGSQYPSASSRSWILSLNGEAMWWEEDLQQLRRIPARLRSRKRRSNQSLEPGKRRGRKHWRINKRRCES